MPSRRGSGSSPRVIRPGRRSSRRSAATRLRSATGCSSKRGYTAVRHAFVMVRPTLDDLPDAPLPAGLEIREVRPEHLPAIWAAHVEAMRDERGFVEPDEAKYQQFLTDPVTSDSTLWRVAWDGDQVAGQVRSFINPEENRRRGTLRGHTEFISVRRPWRRRGLARALIAASFPLLRARGHDRGDARRRHREPVRCPSRLRELRLPSRSAARRCTASRSTDARGSPRDRRPHGHAPRLIAGFRVILYVNVKVATR